MSHVKQFLAHIAAACDVISYPKIEELAGELVKLRDRKGRLFLLGVGGSAANCSHAVNDFRKLCGIEAYAPTDNVSEITARTNDDGWPRIFRAWLITSRFNASDAIMVFSVGGGDLGANISVNIILAVDCVKDMGGKVFGIVGRAEGYTALHGDCVIVVPKVNPDLITPISESFQAIVLHSLVSHPALAIQKAKWESAV